VLPEAIVGMIDASTSMGRTRQKPMAMSTII
jgi:hypothetical protein